VKLFRNDPGCFCTAESRMASLGSMTTPARPLKNSKTSRSSARVLRPWQNHKTCLKCNEFSFHTCSWTICTWPQDDKFTKPIQTQTASQMCEKASREASSETSGNPKWKLVEALQHITTYYKPYCNLWRVRSQHSKKNNDFALSSLSSPPTTITVRSLATGWRATAMSALPRAARAQ